MTDAIKPLPCPEGHEAHCKWNRRDHWVECCVENCWLGARREKASEAIEAWNRVMRRPSPDSERVRELKAALGKLLPILKGLDSWELAREGLTIVREALSTSRALEKAEAHRLPRKRKESK